MLQYRSASCGLIGSMAGQLATPGSTVDIRGILSIPALNATEALLSKQRKSGGGAHLHHGQAEHEGDQAGYHPAAVRPSQLRNQGPVTICSGVQQWCTLQQAVAAGLDGGSAFRTLATLSG